MAMHTLEQLKDDLRELGIREGDTVLMHSSYKSLGGGFGFGGYIREKGTIAEIENHVRSIGEHAFDGCRNLTAIHISGNVHYVGKHAFSNIPNLIIYCNAPAKPDSWDDDWCDENCKVYFNLEAENKTPIEDIVK